MHVLISAALRYASTNVEPRVLPVAGMEDALALALADRGSWAVGRWGAREQSAAGTQPARVGAAQLRPCHDDASAHSELAEGGPHDPNVRRLLRRAARPPESRG